MPKYGQIGVDVECLCDCTEFPITVTLRGITSSNVYNSYEEALKNPYEESARNGEVEYNCNSACDRTATEDDSHKNFE